MSSVLYPLSAVLPVNIPLDVRVSCSECPVRAGENRQCGGPGSCEMMWAQFWLDQLSKDTGTGCAGAGGCGCLCSIASPAPATGEWMGLWALGSAWVPPTLAKKDPISQVNISGHTLQSSEGNYLWWDNTRKKLWLWLVMSYELRVTISSLAWGNSSVILTTTLTKQKKDAQEKI